MEREKKKNVTVLILFSFLCFIHPIMKTVNIGIMHFESLLNPDAGSKMEADLTVQK